MNTDIKRAVHYLIEDDKTNLISLEQAKQMVTPQSILVMVDHSKISLTLSKRVLSAVS